jgi:thiol:disulfide interchange protein DsbA
MTSRRPFLRRCAAALLGLAAASAFAAEPRDGIEYLTLPAPQAADASRKVEVIEFFAYYCPHCKAFEPLLKAWVKRQGDKIVFKRVHLPGGASVATQQRLYFALEKMGLADQYHDKLFAAMHEERVPLNTEEQVVDWIAKNGIDRAGFVEAYRSFDVQGRVSRSRTTIRDYGIDHVPAVAIGGRWLTSPSYAARHGVEGGTEAQQMEAVLKVMDYLVAKARQ